MLTAVWAAVIVAVAFWAAGVCMAVYVMLKAARLISVSTTAVASLRERGEQVLERADAAARRADGQVARTEEITASLDEVTASMAELNARLTALAPTARTIAGRPVATIAALLYGVCRAVGLRRAGRPAATAGGRGSGQALPGSPRASLNGGPRRVPTGRWRAALAGPRDEGLPSARPGRRSSAGPELRQ